MESAETTTVYTNAPTDSSDEQIQGVRPEIKEALDSYESFIDKYCEFMVKYNENPDDLSLLTDYLEFMTEYNDAITEIQNLNTDDLTDEEEKYILDVESRINAKLATVS